MKLLIDANLSPQVSDSLNQRGYDAIHVGDIGLLSATDEMIISAAVDLGATVVTADTDFPMLIAMASTALPSVVLLRKVSGLSPADQIDLLLEWLPRVESNLVAGSIVTMSPERVRVRSLPID